jgi:hypothetical protein
MMVKDYRRKRFYFVKVRVRWQAKVLEDIDDSLHQGKILVRGEIGGIRRGRVGCYFMTTPI